MKKNVFKKTLLILSVAIITLTVAAGVFLTIQYNNAVLDKTQLQSFNNGVCIYDDNNNLLDEKYGINRQIIQIETLPDYVRNAFVAVEDKRFYSHNGYDIKRMIKSVLVNLQSGEKKQGGSTITQQLIKNTMLTSDKTYKRKLKEIMLAAKVEKAFSKEEILQMYLNTIYFGSNAYGIENASKIYFDKSASKLSLAEAALLAGIIKSPARYSPKSNTQNSIERKNLVLKAMLENNFITSSEYENALNEKIILADIKNQYENSYYQSVLNQASKQLGLTEKDLIVGQYKIYSYLDNDLQEKIVYEFNKNYSDYDADKMTIIANTKGGIIAYQGDSYFNLYNMKRQPASLIKPLLVYSPAIEHNILSPATPILDDAVSFDNYTPTNFDNKYHGWTSTRECICNSLNIPAVKTLSYMKFDDVFKFADKLNIDLNEQDKNLSLALGSISEGVKPVQLLGAYSALFNGGNYIDLSFIKEIHDQHGNVVYRHNKNETRVFSEDTAYLMTDMLKTCALKGTSKRLSDLPYEVASKTGTASNNGKKTDVWNVAYTTEHCVLSWLGSSNAPLLDNITSGGTATSLTKTMLNHLYKNKKPSAFVRPETIRTVSFDRLDYEQNQRLSLADNVPERFKLNEIFSVSNMPSAQTNCYDLPADPILYVKLKNNSANIEFDANSNCEYELYSVAKGKQNLILKVSQKDEKIIYEDMTVMLYDEVSYFFKITNIHTKESIISQEFKVYPNKYKSDMDTNSKLQNIKSTKKKWYI